MEDVYEISIPTAICNIAKVESFIDSIVVYFKLPEDLLGRITLPIIEAVNNAILYGNKLCVEKYVKIAAHIADGKLFVTVEDEGEGFDYTVIPDPTLPSNVGKESGRGLFLMKTLSDDLIFENNGSKVTLVFILS